MSDTHEVARLIREIRYQHPLGVTTWSACSTEVCDNSARGGRRCVDCLHADLSAIVGPVEAGTFVSATRQAHHSAARMLREDRR